ncbi:MAG: methyl-accepting chemotaxis protein [Verrucomicrobium sp.]|nr:methyl-accepting chemotaxis protein [Verrucomicrobium sp.]
MKNWTIKGKVMAGFAILLAVSLLVGVFSCLHFRSMHHGALRVGRDYEPALAALNRASSLLQNQQVLLLEEMGAVPEAIRGVDDRLDRSLVEADRLLGAFHTEDPWQQAHWTRLKEAQQDYLDKLSTVRRLTLSGQAKEAFAAYHSSLRPALAHWEKELQASYEFNQQAITRFCEETRQEAGIGTIGVIVGILGVLAIGAATELFLVRPVNQTLRQTGDDLGAGADEMLRAAEQVSSSNQLLANGASQQAASLEQIGASLDEIGGATRANAESARKAQDLSGEARQAAEGGAARNAEMQESMQAIREAGLEMEEAIVGIRKSSQEVSKIVRAIDEIAFQTNILALNAAVEAARAGEAGAGFAVVADEVRNLAQRSVAAAKETARLIDAASVQSNRGVAANAKVSASVARITEKSAIVGEGLDHIVGKVREVDSLIGSITTSSQDQHAGLEEIRREVIQLDHVTQANASTAEETAAAAEELNAQASELRELVKVLRTLVGTKSVAKPQPSARSAGPSYASTVGTPLPLAFQRMDVVPPPPPASFPHEAPRRPVTSPDDEFVDM